MTRAPRLHHEQAWTERASSTPFTVIARFASASNLALLVVLDDGRAAVADALDELGPERLLADSGDPRLGHLAVFKPRDGETPLWDFPEGTLHLREIAAFRVSAILGWDLVPGTVMATHAELGPGSLQRFVPHDPECTWFQLRETAAPAVDDQLQRMIAFDVLVDNADRKAGHVLLERGGRASPAVADAVRLVDHGVTFNLERKLRTVAWDRAGTALPERIVDDLARLRRRDLALPQALGDLLDEAEIAATAQRLDGLLRAGTFPVPHGPRVVPWPPV